MPRSPFSKCFLFNYDLFPLPLPPAPASVKGALLSLVTGSRARPLASSLWEEPAGGSQAVRRGRREPQNGSAPSGDAADEPGFPRRLGAGPWPRQAAETRRPEQSGAAPRDGRADRPMVGANPGAARRRLSTASRPGGETNCRPKLPRRLSLAALRNETFPARPALRVLLPFQSR